MRISSAILALALASCGQPEQEEAVQVEQRQVEAAPKFPCAQAGGELVAACTLEREATAEGATLTLRHPDGHFRRFRVSAAGLAAADGAEPARVLATGDQLDVRVGEDRYRLPVAAAQ